jgi:hypothetical protein
MKRKEIINIIPFLLIAAGTAGLLVNEFLSDLSDGLVILFICLNIAGFLTLALSRLRKRSSN